MDVFEQSMGKMMTDAAALGDSGVDTREDKQRKYALEERKLKLEEDRLSLDKANAERQSKETELLYTLITKITEKLN